MKPTSEEKHGKPRESVRRKRETHDLIIEILTQAKTGQRKTHIMTGVGLSYSQLVKYLDCLKKSGFITEKSGMWKTTKKGANVIEACELCKIIAHKTC
jgi:predicted transcriptional regulator